MKIAKNRIEMRVEQIGNYIALNGSTVREAAHRFGVSKSTVHRDITERLKNVNYKVYLNAMNALQRNKEERNIRGGASTRAKYTSQKYPQCKIKSCPFCGCMSDNTCKIHNVVESAPWLILEHADGIDYCDRPKVFKDKLNKGGGVS